MKSEAFRDDEGWRVRLEVSGRLFVSHVYQDKSCAEVSAGQQVELYEAFKQGRGRTTSWASFEAYLDKLVPWFDWQEHEIKEERGMEEAATAGNGAAKNPFNVKKTIKAEQCAAMRCQEQPLVAVDGARWGHAIQLPLCKRHAAEAGALVVETEGETTSLVSVAQTSTALDFESKKAYAKIFTPDIQAELEGISAEADELLGALKDFKITSQAELEAASETLRDVKAKTKVVNEVLAELEGPYTTLVGYLRGAFDPVKKRLNRAELELKKHIGAAKIAEMQDNLQAMQRVADAYQAGDTQALQVAHTSVRSEANVAGVNTYIKWDFEITDEMALPREFLMPNEKLIREHCNHSTEREPTPIPGVRFFPKPVVSAKASQI